MSKQSFSLANRHWEPVGQGAREDWRASVRANSQLICTRGLWTRPALNLLSKSNKQNKTWTVLLFEDTPACQYQPVPRERDQRTSKEQVYKSYPLVLGTIITSFAIWDPISYIWQNILILFCFRLWCKCGDYWWLFSVLVFVVSWSLNLNEKVLIIVFFILY